MPTPIEKWLANPASGMSTEELISRVTKLEQQLADGEYYTQAEADQRRANGLPIELPVRYTFGELEARFCTTVNVGIGAILRRFTEGESQVELPLLEPSLRTVGGAITLLCTQFPLLDEANLVAEGELARYLNVYVNDEDARYLHGLETPLVHGDVVDLLPAVAGGG